jgi:hypothetical protein
MVFGETGESLIEPDIIPPLHGNVISKPHVAQLVSNRPAVALDLHGRCVKRVSQENFARQRYTSPIFHSSDIHHWQTYKIHLWQWKGNAKVSLVELKRLGCQLDEVSY